MIDRVLSFQDWERASAGLQGAMLAARRSPWERLTFFYQD
jgi:hypothetical protein